MTRMMLAGKTGETGDHISQQVCGFKKAGKKHEKKAQEMSRRSFKMNRRRKQDRLVRQKMERELIAAEDSLEASEQRLLDLEAEVEQAEELEKKQKQLLKKLSDAKKSLDKWKMKTKVANEKLSAALERSKKQDEKMEALSGELLRCRMDAVAREKELVSLRELRDSLNSASTISRMKEMEESLFSQGLKLQENALEMDNQRQLISELRSSIEGHLADKTWMRSFCRKVLHRSAHLRRLLGVYAGRSAKFIHDLEDRLSAEVAERQEAENIINIEGKKSRMRIKHMSDCVDEV